MDFEKYTKFLIAAGAIAEKDGIKVIKAIRAFEKKEFNRQKKIEDDFLDQEFGWG